MYTRFVICKYNLIYEFKNTRIYDLCYIQLRARTMGGVNVILDKDQLSSVYN